MTPHRGLDVLCCLWIACGQADYACTADSGARPAVVRIVLADAPSARETAAAAELAGYLRRLYPGHRFQVGGQAAADSPVIYLGTLGSAPGPLKQVIDPQRLQSPESCLVARATIEGRPCAGIVGADPAGVVYGVYRLLEKLGCGFYLGFDSLPEPAAGPLKFEGWELADRPVVPVRIVFDWHNFLSGCSTWNLEHWKTWISQSQKMGYNAVMVHAYGNNPMASFEFQGVPKPVGFLSSTRVGRDWSTAHVNDVRRLWGGELFDSPVFGSDAAVDGPPARRTAAAEKLMAAAFNHAQKRGVAVYFAVDVDTASANPQELIRLLPERARFQIDVPPLTWMGQDVGKAWLADPDTAEGYALYRAQVERLLQVYPAINCLVVWHRKDRTPWMAFTEENMPQAWREQYASELAKKRPQQRARTALQKPEVAGKAPPAEALWHSHHLFAQAKIVRAFRRAVKELGRSDVSIAFGSWDFDFLPAADLFLPEGVPLIPLDWMVLRDASVFDAPERRQAVARVAEHRPVFPIAWAHHDDGNYVGRPYTPPANFLDRLAEMKCDSAGFGIIHWTTRPLDLYFKSLADQVMASHRNQPLEATCRAMAMHLVGSAQADRFGAYLEAWITTMPKIGRETSDFFIDHELKDLAETEEGFRRRMAILQSVDRSRVGSRGALWLDYFAGLEQYILEVYRTEDSFNRAKRQFADGDPRAARATLARCRPESVIEHYAKFSSLGSPSRGEQGLVVSMNTRWLPHYARFRQQLGMEPVRYNFAPTSHDPLAQSRGTFTFHFDRDRTLWQTLGTQETGCRTVAVEDPALAGSQTDVYRAGIELDSPLRLALAPILYSQARGRIAKGELGAGRYRLTLFWLDRRSSASEKQAVSVALAAEEKPAGKPPRAKVPLSPVVQQFDFAGPVAGSARSVSQTVEARLSAPGMFQLTLTPLSGKPLLSGLILEPIDVQGKRD